MALDSGGGRGLEAINSSIRSCVLWLTFNCSSWILSVLRPEEVVAVWAWFVLSCLPCVLWLCLVLSFVLFHWLALPPYSSPAPTPLNRKTKCEDHVLFFCLVFAFHVLPYPFFSCVLLSCNLLFGILVVFLYTKIKRAASKFCKSNLQYGFGLRLRLWLRFGL